MSRATIKGYKIRHGYYDLEKFVDFLESNHPLACITLKLVKHWIPKFHDSLSQTITEEKEQ